MKEKILKHLNKYALIWHGVLSLFIVFIMEALSRHSAIKAIGFMRDHTIAYLYNAYIIFCIYCFTFLFRRRNFVRFLISFLLLTMGVANCIVLSNRISPLGFPDFGLIGDLLTMEGTNYFPWYEALACGLAASVCIFLLFILYRRGLRHISRFKFWMRGLFFAGLILSIGPVTQALRTAGYIDAYFGNLAQGYLDNGYVYGFATSALDRGMTQPIMYSKSTVNAILKEEKNKNTVTSSDEMPNIVVMLLESFSDPDEIKFLSTDQDPVPFFHQLRDNYSSGYLTVPVVGAGTCNTEFEVLTGMSCQFFGPGEYPQKTIFHEIDYCESYADILKDLNYKSCVVHNNGGNFYSRKNAFSKMGFDRFICKETLDINEFTPLGSWPTDDILIQPTIDVMDSTEEKDFVYTITVEAHGDYPTTQIVENPAISVNAKGKTQEENYQWSYYINQLHEVDDFLSKYIQALDDRGEPTLVIMFCDHYPSLNLVDSDVKKRDLYKTKYITWNNFDMPVDNKPLASYQLMSKFLGDLGVHEGTFNAYHQYEIANKIPYGSIRYFMPLEILQYDALYGEKYAHEKDPLSASDIEMGLYDIRVAQLKGDQDTLQIIGKGFTRWSYVFVNDDKVNTTYVNGQLLTIDEDDVKVGDVITVCQVGSGNDIFRKSNSYTVLQKHINQLKQKKNK